MLPIPTPNHVSLVDNPYRQYMYAYPHKRAYRKFDKADIRQYLCHLAANTNHLYIHLPFCHTKCGFCNLFSVTGKHPSYIDEYLDAIERQLQQYSKPEEVQAASFSSLVIGGGTPLLLSEHQLERLFSLVEKYLPLKLSETYTVIETSPAYSDESKLRLIRSRGVNRISLGVQSFVLDELKTLGRSHSVKEAQEALGRIKKTGFDELNVDLIYGIPKQTVESVGYSVNKTLEYQPQEIFIYPLYLKEGTCMYRLTEGYKDVRLEMYKVVRNLLLASGYRQTSMRRFALNGLEQSASCGFDNVLALGCGGRSYLGNLHFCEPFAVNQQQCKRIVNSYVQQTDFYHAAHGYVLNDDEQRRRYAIKHLLFYTGINETEYRSIFKSDVSVDFPFIADLINLGYVLKQNGMLALTPEGLALSDYIGPMFISDEVQHKMNTFRLL